MALGALEYLLAIRTSAARLDERPAPTDFGNTYSPDLPIAVISVSSGLAGWDRM